MCDFLGRNSQISMLLLIILYGSSLQRHQKAKYLDGSSGSPVRSMASMNLPSWLPAGGVFLNGCCCYLCRVLHLFSFPDWRCLLPIIAHEHCSTWGTLEPTLNFEASPLVETFDSSTLTYWHNNQISYHVSQIRQQDLS